MASLPRKSNSITRFSPWSSRCNLTYSTLRKQHLPSPLLFYYLLSEPPYKQDSIPVAFNPNTSCYSDITAFCTRKGIGRLCLKVAASLSGSLSFTNASPNAEWKFKKKAWPQFRVLLLVPVFIFAKTQIWKTFTDEITSFSFPREDFLAQGHC